MTPEALGLTPELVLGYALVLARTVPLAFLAPWLGMRGTLGAARLTAAAVLALALTGPALVHAAPLPGDPLSLAGLTLREALIGAAFAVAVSVPVFALAWTGDLLDRFHTARDARPGPLGTLYLGAGVALFVLVGGHRLALRAYADGFATLPLGAPPAEGLALGVAQTVGVAFALTLAFAAPAALAFVLLEVGLGLAARASPAVREAGQALSLRAGLALAAALGTLAVLAPRLPAVFEESIRVAREVLSG